MGNVLQGYRFIDDETREALGLPENVYDLTIKANVEGVVTVECSYFAPLGDPEKHATLLRRLKTFVLHEISDEEIEEIDDERVERDGADPMTPENAEEDDD